MTAKRSASARVLMLVVLLAAGGPLPRRRHRAPPQASPLARHSNRSVDLLQATTPSAQAELCRTRSYKPTMPPPASGGTAPSVALPAAN